MVCPFIAMQLPALQTESAHGQNAIEGPGRGRQAFGMSAQYGGGFVQGGGSQPMPPAATGQVVVYCHPLGQVPASETGTHMIGPPPQSCWTQNWFGVQVLPPHAIPTEASKPASTLRSHVQRASLFTHRVTSQNNSLRTPAALHRFEHVSPAFGHIPPLLAPAGQQSVFPVPSLHATRKD